MSIERIKLLEKAKEFRKRLGQVELNKQKYGNLEVERTTLKKQLRAKKALKEDIENSGEYQNEANPILRNITRCKGEIEFLQEEKNRLRKERNDAINPIKVAHLNTEKNDVAKEIKDIEAELEAELEILKQIREKYNLPALKEDLQQKNSDIEDIEKEEKDLGFHVFDSIPESRFEKKGYYAVAINKQELKFLCFDADDEVSFRTEFKKKIGEFPDAVLSYKKVDDIIAEAWDKAIEIENKAGITTSELFALAHNKTTIAKNIDSRVAVQAETDTQAGINVNLDKLEVNAHVHATAEGKGTMKIIKGLEMDLVGFVETYASVAASATGIIAEVGVSTKVNVGVGNKYAKFSSGAYGQAKAGAFITPIGILVSAEAEGGLEVGLALNSPKLGKFNLSLDATFTAYGKAEAKAGIGVAKQESGANFGAVAGIKTGLKLTIKGGLVYDDNEAGSLTGEADIAVDIAAAGAYAEAALKIGDKIIDNAGVAKTIYEIGFDVDAAVLLGGNVGVKITLELVDEYVEKLENKILEELKKLIKRVVGQKIYGYLKAFTQEIQHYIKKIDDMKHVVKSTLAHQARKGLIAVQTEGKNKVKLKFGEYKSNIKDAKQEIEKAIAALEAKGIKDLGDNLTDEKKAELDQAIQDIINGCNNPEIKELISGRARKDLMKDLKKYVKKYDKLLVKFNTDIQDRYEAYAKRIDKHSALGKSLLEEFEVLLEQSKQQNIFVDKDAFVATINKKAKKLNSLITTINKISTDKDELMEMQNFDNGVSLPNTDFVPVFEEIETAYNDLESNIDLLIGKIEDLRSEIIK